MSAQADLSRTLADTGSVPVRRAVLDIFVHRLWCQSRMAASRVHHSKRGISSSANIHVQAQSMALLPLRVRVIVRAKENSEADAPASATSSTSSTCCGSGCSRPRRVSLSAATSSRWVSQPRRRALRRTDRPGPIASAIITWRNSMVFHSLDKVISLFIHMYVVPKDPYGHRAHSRQVSSCSPHCNQASPAISSPT